MKKLIIIFLSIGSFSLLVSCDKGFDEMNQNPVQPTSLDPGFLLNNAILLSTFDGTTLPYELAIVQQIVSPNSGIITGGNYNQDNRPVTRGNWDKYYRDVLKHTTDVKRMTMEDETRSNLYQMARIIHSFASMVLTDSYGEVPYFNAGLGHLEGNVTPSYDPQQDIYMDIMAELDAAAMALDPMGTQENVEVLYGGDVSKWKKLAYSLMLRAAMRLVKVDPATAREYVTKALQGGVMESNEDNAIIRHDFNYQNEVGGILNSTEANNYYLTQPFIEHLQTTNDPRLGSIAVRYVGATSGPDQNDAIAGNAPEGVTLSVDPEVQIGMPMGYDNATIIPVAQEQGLASFYGYSQLDRTRMGAQNAPAFLVSYAQTSLLLAEAAVRGWVQGDAAALYEQAIRAHMAQLSAYGSGAAIDQPAIDAYVASQSLNSAGAIEQINTQYWVVSFLNGPESFANFRRTGYPALTPNPFPGSEITGDFIRRLTYPDSEKAVNSGNINEAISRQGADNLDTRVWWDPSL